MSINKVTTEDLRRMSISRIPKKNTRNRVDVNGNASNHHRMGALQLGERPSLCPKSKIQEEKTI